MDGVYNALNITKECKIKSEDSDYVKHCADLREGKSGPAKGIDHQADKDAILKNANERCQATVDYIATEARAISAAAPETKTTPQNIKDALNQQ